METPDFERTSKVKGWGADLRFEDRPGVPKLKEPPEPLPGAHVDLNKQAIDGDKVTRRTELPSLTPVFGTPVPPAGFSGLLRRFAYRIPEHQGRHWLLLMLADRVDVIEHRLGRGKWLLLGATAFAGIGLARRFQRSRAPVRLAPV